MPEIEKTAAGIVPASAMPRPSLIGRALGDFLIKEKLGEGGGGAVYVAEQQQLGREVVVKVLHATSVERNPLFRQRFLREARLASAVDHPFAAHIYSFGSEADGVLWLAMELVRGTPLNEWIKTQGTVPIHRLVPFLERLCEVVQTLHQQGIVHRDLKPANVMVISRAGRMLPKLLDLGIAKLWDLAKDPNEPEDAPAPAAHRDVSALQRLHRSENGPLPTPNDPESSEQVMALQALTQSINMEITSNEDLLGSPPYMAPEQWQKGSVIGPAADLYALSVLAFEALTGKVPFREKSVLALARAHLTAPIPSLGQQFPPQLDAFFQRALAKDPAERFTNALELSAALREAAAVKSEGFSLTHLQGDLLDTVLRDFPQPLAEAASRLEAARHPEHAVGALLEVRRSSVRHLGVIALSAYAKLAAGAPLAEGTLALLRRLRTQSLSDPEWWRLCQDLCQPFQVTMDLHPVPELVALCVEEQLAPSAPLHALLQASPGPGTDLVPQLGELESALARWLQRLQFLRDYPLARAVGAEHESWAGLRRTDRPVLPGAAEAGADGRFALLDAEGGTLLTLYPLLQAIAPTPGAALEPFYLEGPGRSGARLVSLPSGFERHDASVWSWFTSRIAHLETGLPVSEESDVTPFMGLSSYSAKEAKNYFGRESEAEAFANRLRQHSFLAIVGPSGAGKSSFIQAGVLPLLPAEWRTVIARPGPAPFAALADRLIQAGVLEAEQRDTLGATPERLREVMAAHARRTGGTLLLVVDQFEELVTLCSSAEEQVRFADALVGAGGGRDGNTKVVVTLRDDFLIRLQGLGPLRERLAQGLQLLSTPAAEDLLRILTEPVRVAGYTFEEPELPKEMVKAVEKQAGALALLSFTASKLWERRDRDHHILTRKAYAALGGVGGALAHHAEATLAEMSEPSQKLVREAFRQLVTADGTRAVLGRSQLLEVLGGSAAAAETLEKLILARLLVTSEGAGGEDRVEVIHEALLSSWPRLVKWQKEDAENVRMRDQLRAAARQWDARGRSRGLLWRGDALVEYRLWRGRYPGGLTRSEEAFADASLRDDARGKRLRTAVFTTAFAGLLVGLALVTRANQQTALRLAEFHAEQGRIAVLSNDVLSGLMYLSRALDEGVSNRGVRFMLARALHAMEGQEHLYAEHSAAVGPLALTPDGRQALTGSADGTVRLWDVATGNTVHVFAPKAGSVTGLSLSGDGTRLAICTLQGNLSTHALSGEPVAQRSFGAPCFNVAFVPGSQALVATLASGEVHFFEGADLHGEQVRTGPVGHAALAFSPKGDWLVTAPGVFYTDDSPPKDGAAVAWDLKTHALRFRLEHPGSRVEEVSFSPDGTKVATAGHGGAVKLWDLGSGKLEASLLGHAGAVMAVAFSPDGKLLATGGQDKMLRLWDVSSHALLRTLEGHSASVYPLRFDKDGRRLFSASNDATVRVWETDSGQLQWVYRGHTGAVLGTRLTPDGRKLVTTSNDGSARVWRADLALQDASFPHPARDAWARLSRDGHRVLRLTTTGDLESFELGSGAKLHAGHIDGGPHYFAWSGSESLVVTDDGAKIRLWSYPELQPQGVLEGHTASLELLEISPDDRLLLSASDDRTAKIWDLATRQLLRTLQVGEAVTGAFFSPDGRRIATTDTAGRVSLFETATGKLLRVWPAHRSPAFPVAFSPDGNALLSGASDHQVYAWDLRSGERLSALGEHGDAIVALDFAPDGALAMTASAQGLVRIWETQTWRQVGQYAAGRGLTFGAFVASGEQLLTGGGLSEAMALWPVGSTSQSPAEVAREVRCRVAYEFKRDQLVPAKPDPAACERTPKR